METLLSPVQPSDPAVFFHVHTSGTTRGNLESIKSDYRDLRVKVGGMEDSVLQNSAGEGKGCKEDGTDSVCQLLVAELVLAAGFGFL